ncbi:MAG TPA: hypothetical protein VFS32_09875 [Candidatus Limnocylindrales bacterium]|nr:hypothetical protein [Candidatus Limnocylindrales bacterium]
MPQKPTTRIDGLLLELCRRHGFCSIDADLLLQNPPATVDRSVDLILASEGLDPDDYGRSGRRELAHLVGEWVFDEGHGKGSASGLP